MTKERATARSGFFQAFSGFAQKRGGIDVAGLATQARPLYPRPLADLPVIASRGAVTTYATTKRESRL
jgi:hypothetical protein